ncbi:UDP-N-acetylmuramate--L-alanine ligase [Actinotalea sp. BY-33]|uniref:UDP-N-acetylmuramate--L-alanine ligase n=2 Tax=Actinotalea soli TaxID=2819234 RepID=A0A939LRK9_9CELL|nr:UDP-N-acetylmuramate--L-alanine ligase [Actinotalea soli]
MSVVAALLAARGLVVSGSDARPGPVLDALAARGVTVHVGHASSNLGTATTLVVSTAIRPDNPELLAARDRGLRVLHRSQALAALMQDRTAVAVAGAHGKTTTSAMIAVTLAGAGLDPSYAVGGTVQAVASPEDPAPAVGVLAGARDGHGPVFVAEADESDGSFLAYRPTIAVVTNVEPDHLDHYGTREAFEEAFVRFVDQVVPDGHLVACADDPGSRELAARTRARGRSVVTYGTGSEADLRLEGWQAHGSGSTATLVEAGLPPVALDLTVPGLHNARNAAAAYAAARLLGVDGPTAARALSTFTGTGRRFEDRGAVRGVRVVDDYAHHPTEVEALLRAARPVAGGGRVLVLFQPHLYSRTRTFAAEFAQALGLADVVVVTDVYGAREDPDPQVTGALITEPLRATGHDATFVPDRLEAARRIGAAAREGDLVLTVGAGDVTTLAPEVLAAVPG